MGVMRSYDQFSNIVLEDTHERHFVGGEPRLGQHGPAALRRCQEKRVFHKKKPVTFDIQQNRTPCFSIRLRSSGEYDRMSRLEAS